MGKRVGAPRRSVSRPITRREMNEFYKRNNIIALLLLIFTIVLIISTAKVVDKLGEYEEDKALYGQPYAGYVTGDAVTNETTAKVSITIGVEEVAPTAPSPGSGTGAKAEPGSIALDVVQDSFLVDISKGDRTTRKLALKNTGRITLDIIASTNLRNYISITPSRMIVAPEAIFELALDFTGRHLGVHTGYIKIEGSGLVSHIPVILEVSSKAAVGDLSIFIPKPFQQIKDGGEMLLNVEMNNFNAGIIDIVYIVKDSEDNEVLKTVQIKTISDELDFDKTLKLPQGLKDGVYVVAVEVRFRGMAVVDSTVITIGEPTEPVLEKPAPLLGKIRLSRGAFNLTLSIIVLMIIISSILYSRGVRRMMDESIAYGKKK
tara:strand:+ start:7032 stop:8156 length:1125 start_codon:yes stop_codon:yes gene_type:complete